MSENFPNLAKDMCIGSRSPTKPKQDELKEHHTNIITKHLKTKDENILKAAFVFGGIYQEA